MEEVAAQVVAGRVAILAGASADLSAAVTVGPDLGETVEVMATDEEEIASPESF